MNKFLLACFACFALSTSALAEDDLTLAEGKYDETTTARVCAAGAYAYDQVLRLNGYADDSVLRVTAMTAHEWWMGFLMGWHSLDYASAGDLVEPHYSRIKEMYENDETNFATVESVVHECFLVQKRWEQELETPDS